MTNRQLMFPPQAGWKRGKACYQQLTIRLLVGLACLSCRQIRRFFDAEANSWSGWADNPVVYEESQLRSLFERVVGMHESMFRSSAFVREPEAALPDSLIIRRVKEAPVLNS